MSRLAGGWEGETVLNSAHRHSIDLDDVVPAIGSTWKATFGMSGAARKQACKAACMGNFAKLREDGGGFCCTPRKNVPVRKIPR